MSIRTPEELAALERVGRVAAEAREAMREALVAGMTTIELDAVGRRVLDRYGARSAPHLVYGFPGVNCISVNEEVVHGIPKRRAIRSGDVVKIDVTAELGGFMADTACTVIVPPAPPGAEALAECARAAFRAAFAVARAGARVRDIGRAVQREVERRGFAVVEGLNGHGIGRTIHESPTIPNVDDPEANEKLTANLVVTIEPIIAMGRGIADLAPDGWTVRTRDGGLAAHYEHTVVIGKGEPRILTRLAA